MAKQSENTPLQVAKTPATNQIKPKFVGQRAAKITAQQAADSAAIAAMKKEKR